MNFIRLRQLRGWLARLFDLFHRKRREREFAEELESHLVMHIEDNLRAGMSREEARRVAVVKLGGVTQVQELHQEICRKRVAQVQTHHRKDLMSGHIV
jgi:macrolide transport system ATP-binding/permease protein